MKATHLKKPALFVLACAILVASCAERPAKPEGAKSADIDGQKAPSGDISTDYRWLRLRYVGEPKPLIDDQPYDENERITIEPDLLVEQATTEANDFTECRATLTKIFAIRYRPASFRLTLEARSITSKTRLFVAIGDWRTDNISRFSVSLSFLKANKTEDVLAELPVEIPPGRLVHMATGESFEQATTCRLSFVKT